MIIYDLITNLANTDDTIIESYPLIRLVQAVNDSLYSSILNILKDMCVVYD
jgi:hypothetical protein